MIFVYALCNTVNSEIYIGITKDLSRRIKEHNSGKNRYTKAFMPWALLYVEETENYLQARKREKYLKSAAGKRSLKKSVLTLDQKAS